VLRKIDCVRVRVDDLDRAVAWVRDASFTLVDMTRGPREPNGGG
jgi:hypothetical protein